MSPFLCEVSCFAASYNFATVPYFSLDEARSVHLIYNGDQAAPRPFIHVNVNSSDDGQGMRYTLQATLNGTPITFLNGQTVLNFVGSGGVPVRLGGQFDGRAYATDVYPLTITVKATWSDGFVVTKSETKQLLILNEAGSQVASGWTIAGIQRLRATTKPGYMITNGDGSVIRFSGLGVVAADFTVLTYDSPSATYTRTYPDGSRAKFNSSGQQTSFIEVNGRTRSFGYDALGRVQTIADPFRKQPNQSPTFIGLSYDGNGLHAIQEPSADGTPWAGRTTSFVVDGNRCLLSAQDPDGAFTRFTCDANDRLSTITDRLGSVSTLGYDSNSWKLSQVVLPVVAVDAGGGSTTPVNPVVNLSAWQTQGVPQTLTSPASPWDAPDLESVTGSVTDPSGRITSFAPNEFGQAATITNPAGQITTITRSGTLPTRVRYADGGTDTLMYDALGRLTKNHPSGGSPTNYHYNANGLIDIISGPGARVDTLYYNANKQVYLEVFGGTPRQTISYTYDPSTLRVATAQDNAGHTSSYLYDSRFGNLSSTTIPGSRVSTTAFDRYGRDSVTTLPTLAPRTVLYDVLNRVVSSSDGVGTTTISYQPLQIDVNDANGNHYSNVYNALGWPIQSCDPLLHCSSARYDASGLFTSSTNRRGQIVSLTRDALGRVTSKSGVNTVTNNYSYSPDGRIMVGWNAVERDSIFSNPGSDIARMTDSVVTWISGRRYRVFHSARNAVAGTDSTSIISNTAVLFKTRKATYDAGGFLTSISDGLYTSTITATGEGAGQVIGYGVGGTRTSAPTALHELKQLSFSASGPANTFGRDYHYDLAGRIDQKHSVGDPSKAYFYGYDGLGRLQSYDLRSSCSASTADSTSGIGHNCPGLLSHEGYTYDAMGNRTDNSAVVTAGNRYQSFNGATIAYDNDGNVTQKHDPAVANRDYFWSAEGQLDSVVQNNWDRVRYDYNAFGQPVRKQRNNTPNPTWWDDSYFLWDGDHLLAEFDPTGNRRSDYVYFPGTVDQPYAHSVGSTSVTGERYQQQDALGNVVGTMDNGNVSQTASYDAWGNLSLGGNSDNRLFWKGLMWEGDIVSLYYVRNRWYDPDVGRFMSEDPSGFEGGLNLYTFAGDDPINGSDPSGLGDDEDCYVVVVTTYYERTGEVISREIVGRFCRGSSDGGQGKRSRDKPKTDPKTRYNACIDATPFISAAAALSILPLGNLKLSQGFRLTNSSPFTSIDRRFPNLPFANKKGGLFVREVGSFGGFKTAGTLGTIGAVVGTLAASYAGTTIVRCAIEANGD